MAPASWLLQRDVNQQHIGMGLARRGGVDPRYFPVVALLSTIGRQHELAALQ